MTLGSNVSALPTRGLLFKRVSHSLETLPSPSHFLLLVFQQEHPHPNPSSEKKRIDERKTGEVVILMIAFIGGGMTIPMGTLTRNFLRYFRLSPTQCAPNMFRILGSIESLNERMNLNLTHHDVNWVYNLHNLKG